MYVHTVDNTPHRLSLQVGVEVEVAGEWLWASDLPGFSEENNAAGTNSE